MKAYIIIPTINIPFIIEAYCKNFARFGHKDDVGIIIVGDHKSPVNETEHYVKKFTKKGFEVEFTSISKVKKWTQKYKGLTNIIRDNSDSRRIVGYLMALERNCNFIISIDDDNYPFLTDDVFQHHAIVGKSITLPVISTNTDWFNICTMLETTVPNTIYPRGFPYRERHKKIIIKTVTKKVLIGANIGLWINEPDIDSITRLTLAPKAIKFTGHQLALAPGCNTPINTQNTALVADLIPAYYYILMGEIIDGMILDRDGDIWTGWFLRKVMDALGYHLSVGHPVSDHRRNTHDNFRDLRHELGCIMYSEQLTQILKEVKPKGRNGIEVYDDLTDKFKTLVIRDKKLSPDFKKYVKKLHTYQKIWLQTIQQIIDTR